MKWSRYNYFFEGELKFFLYNSLSNSFAEFDSDTYHELYKMKELEQVEVKDEELKKHLTLMKAFVENDQDEINKIKYLVLLRRFNDSTLHLTINPTLDCNFACSYCFEGKHSHIYMTDKVEDEIVEYIKKQKSAQYLSITWFGGEPLLAFKRVISLTEKIKHIGVDFGAGMITNGYLLNRKIINKLTSLNIRTLQITIDGLASLHDGRRHLVSGKGTFGRIVDNIDLLKKYAPEVNVSVRVNVDETNKDDFIKLYRMFHEKRYPYFNIAPAFVDDISGCQTNNNIFNRKKQAAFLIELQEKYGLDFSYFYPKNIRYECPVRNRNMVVIGPEGELYKCWNDVGNKHQVVGYLNGEIINEKLLLRYLNGADPFDDVNCKECLLLPVCGGGCPYIRLKREYEGANVDPCSLLKDNMDKFLLLHYHNSKFSKD